MPATKAAWTARPREPSRPCSLKR